MTEFIKKSVKGVAPDVSSEVLEGKNNNDLLRASYGLGWEWSEWDYILKGGGVSNFV